MVRAHPTVPAKSIAYSSLRAKPTTVSYHVATTATETQSGSKKPVTRSDGPQVRVLFATSLNLMKLPPTPCAIRGVITWERKSVPATDGKPILYAVVPTDRGGPSRSAFARFARRNRQRAKDGSWKSKLGEKDREFLRASKDRSIR